MTEDREIIPEESGRAPSGRLFWMIAFIYASSAALLLQKVFLPLLPALHAGHGLLFNDATFYHDFAVTIAERIRTEGWGAWSLLPFNGNGLNVGILAALYALFGPEPAYFIPFTAAAHATSALILLKSGRCLWPGRNGTIGGLVAGIAFLVFPSALQWYGQTLKDSFAIAGFLMMLYAQMSIYETNPTMTFRGRLSLMITGALLLTCVRPYVEVLVLGFFFLGWLGLLGISLWHRTSLRREIQGFALLLVIAAFLPMTLHANTSEGAFEGKLANGGIIRQTGWEWHTTPYIPDFADHALMRVSEIRAHFIAYNRTVAAGSGIDENKMPEDALSAVAYLPRALLIGLVAPFPNSWQERVSAPRLVGAMETFAWYLFFPGTLLLLARHPSRPLVFALVPLLGLMTVLAYAYPNVGNLYRARYAYWMFLLVPGAVGWASLLIPWLRQNIEQSDRAPPGCSNETDAAPPAGGVDTAIAAGSLVMSITLVCYLGFFVRDLLLVRIFGMSMYLDGYFFAAMVPMFFASCLTMPMADALMRPLIDSYLNEGHAKAGALARAALWHGMLGIGAITLLLGIFAEPAMRIGLGGQGAEMIAQAAWMFRGLLLVLLMSPWTVIGNTVLNGLHHYRAAALAQLAVPGCTLLAIMASPVEYGVYPAILGMVGGAFANLLIVLWCLHHLEITLWPQPARWSALPSSVADGYRQLALAGIIGAMVTPLGYILAGSLGEGGISLWALASKIVTLFSGLASVGVASVILPRIARLVRERMAQFGNYFLTILFGGSWLGGAVAVLICLFSQPVAAVIIGAGSKDRSIDVLANLLCIGALQVPVMITYTVMTKTSASVDASRWSLISAIAGLISFVALAYPATRHFGAVGLAGATLGAAVIAVLFLAVTLRHACRYGIGTVMILALGWVVWAGACLAAVSEDIVIVLGALIGLVGLGWVHTSRRMTRKGETGSGWGREHNARPSSG